MGAVPLFRVLALVIVVHVAVVGGIVGVLCRTDTVFQVCQCSRRAPDFGDQLIDPVHHRADGVLCDLFHRRKCGVDGIAEGLAGLIGRHETRRQSRQQGHHQTDGVRLENRVQTCLRDCKTGRPGFGGFVSSGHGRGRGSVNHFNCSSGGYIALVGQECCSGSGHNSSGNADGLLELGHLLVAVEEGDHHLVQLDHQITQSRKQAAGQLTGQGADIILQGGHAPAEGLAGFQHTVVELPALTGGGFHSCFQLAEADLAVRNALVQVGHALAGGIADLVQRVETRIDHHVDVFQRDLLCRGHLAVGAGQGLQLFGVAQRDITQPLQHAGGVVCRNAELQKGLGAAGQIIQREGRGCRHLADLGKLCGGGLLAAQHDLEVGQVAFHGGVVVHAAFDHLGQLGRSLFCKVRDHLPGGYRPLTGAFFCRVAVQPYFAGDAEICHCVHLSFGARAQGHRLL